LGAFRAHGVSPHVTVVDLCETPLALNRWYAERAGVGVVTQRDDILVYEDAAGFDAICTHAFFGRFSPVQRQALLARWYHLLRPGGSVITVTPVRPGHATAMVGFAPDQVQAFRTKVQAGAESLRDAIQMDPELLADAAARYASRHRVYPVRSEQELESLFRGAGFTIEHLSRVPPVTDVQHGVHGPTVAGIAAYTRVVAVRGQT
jgi:SAM-dependent methyltransferase